MKIFALYIKIKLTEKPEWFEEFLEKYFEAVDLHITLIQPRYFDEKQTGDLEFKVSELIKRVNAVGDEKKLFFDKLVVDKGSDGKYILMLNCRGNNFLNNFQKELGLSLKDYNFYVDDSTKEYEINFNPHITIAIDLDEHSREEAEKYFVSDYRFEGVIGELVLAIVKDQSIEERKNVNNQKIFIL